MVESDLERRVLSFDSIAAEAAGRLAAAARKAGRPAEVQDIQIAGTAKSRNAALATRNTRHFQNTGIALIDPWRSGVA